MCAEVDLADVVVLQDGGVSGVGSVVGSAVVQGAAGGEGQAGVQPVLLYQLTGAVLQPLAGGEEARRREREMRSKRKFCGKSVHLKKAELAFSTIIAALE